MRQLTNALVEAREGMGDVRSVLLRAAFKPRLPGEMTRTGETCGCCSPVTLLPRI